MATTPRVSPGANQDNTARQDTNDYKNPVYAAAITIVTRQKRTVVQVGQLTGAITVNLGVGSASLAPFVGDTLQILFSSDGTSRTVTWGTGTAITAATLVLGISKKAFAEFMFDGTVWVETSRSTQA